ncbi:40S ribosomal protein S7 [Dendrobium catenatum]|uniref:40S ribosomal protein S7 n=1 Tax=Dendrobium catenatum TaxID=906689 RepID=A0A2I0WN27_9ASPA|nr:40S ribosomal protein S7 [Dendrobium catenatum]
MEEKKSGEELPPCNGSLSLFCPLKLRMVALDVAKAMTSQDFMRIGGFSNPIMIKKDKNICITKHFYIFLTNNWKLLIKMFTARKKIHKEHDAEPSEFEESVAQALFDLENTNQELKSDLKDLFINSAAQIDISGNRKSIVIHVPYRIRKAFRKIHVRLVRELEKKFSGKKIHYHPPYKVHSDYFSNDEFLAS